MSKHQRILVVRLVGGSGICHDTWLIWEAQSELWRSWQVIFTGVSDSDQRSNAFLAMLWTAVHNSKMNPLNNPVLKVTLYLCLGRSAVSRVSALSRMSAVSRVSPLCRMSTVSRVTALSRMSAVSRVSAVSKVSALSRMSAVSRCQLCVGCQ